MLLFFVHLRSQQKRTESHLQLSNLQCCHFDIVSLRVAIVFKMSAFSVDTGRQMTPPLVDGVVHTRLVQFAHMVRCAHKLGYVINFITVVCKKLAKVTVKNKMSRFLWFTV